jgi:hypothetical protein
MPTKADAFRARTERSGSSKAKAPPRPRRDSPVNTAEKGVSATDRKVGSTSTATRNRSERASKKTGSALEDSATGKASRKSTRASVNGAKRDSNLKRRATRKARSPKTRAAKARAQAS